MALTAVDRLILQRCLIHDTAAWNDFVDRFLGLIYHAIHHTAHLRSTPVGAEAVEDIAQSILTQIAASDYALLRQFRGNSSLATYLTVIARRICLDELSKRFAAVKPLPSEFKPTTNNVPPGRESEEKADAEVDKDLKTNASLESLEQVQKLVRKLPARQRDVVRMYYLEGRTYEEISTELNMPVTEITPILKAARKVLRPGGPIAKAKAKAKKPPVENGEA